MAKTKQQPPTTIEVDISEVKPNAQNPRIIKDDKFKKLVQSIKDFPEMLFLRPVVVNKEHIILGGNYRYRAAVEAGRETIPIIVAEHLSPEQEQEFIIKDNVSGGDWDFDVLANEWNVQKLSDWGLDVWQPDDIDVDAFFEDKEEEPEEKSGKHIIVLTYEDEGRYNQVKARLDELGGKKEDIIFNLLDL